MVEVCNKLAGSQSLCRYVYCKFEFNYYDWNYGYSTQPHHHSTIQPVHVLEADMHAYMVSTLVQLLRLISLTCISPFGQQLCFP